MFFNLKFIFLLFWNLFYLLWIFYFLSLDTLKYSFYFFIIFWFVGLFLIVWVLDFNFELFYIGNFLIKFLFFVIFLFLCYKLNLIFLKEFLIFKYWNLTYSSFPFVLLVFVLEFLILSF